MGRAVVLLCLCVAHVWCQSTDTPTSPTMTPTARASSPNVDSTDTPTSPTTTLTARASPPNVDRDKLLVAATSETVLSFFWNRPDNNRNYSYILIYSNGTDSDPISGSGGGNLVIHTVSFLSPGTRYAFTLITVFEGVRSSGLHFSAVTMPSNVGSVSVKERSETHLVLEWTKVNNNPSYSYILKDSSGAETPISGSGGGDKVTHPVSSLSAGTKHTFTLFTVFEGVKSTGLTFSAVTMPSNVASVSVKERSETHLVLEWTKVNNNPSYSYILKDSSGAETPISGSGGGDKVTHPVSSLSAGTKHTFTLFTVFEGVKSTGLTFSAVTMPSNVGSVSVKERSETHLVLEWTKVNNNPSYSYILKDSSGAETPISGSGGGDKVTHPVSSLSAGTKHTFTLFTVFEGVKSTGLTFSAVTMPSNVASVSVKERSETHLVLEWTKVNNDLSYSYILKDSSGAETPISGSGGGDKVTHTVSSLSAGTIYDFTLFTVFEGVRSSGHNFSAIPLPSNVASVSVKERSETHLVLEWTKVNNNLSYSYILMDSSGAETPISGSGGGDEVTHTVSSLPSGTKYDFTLFTVFEGVRSSGHNFSAITMPSKVDSVSVKERSETHLLLEWAKVNNNPSYSYILKDGNGAETPITGSGEGDKVTHTVSPLFAGTNYIFTLFTVFEEVNSSGFNFTAVTPMNCATSDWSVTNSTIEADILGLFSMATASNGTDVSDVNGAVATGKVSFSKLHPGSTYNVSLWYELDSAKLLQCTHNVTLVPSRVTGLRCGYLSGGYALALLWDAPFGVWTEVQVDMSGKSSHTVIGTETQIDGLQPAQTYSMTVTSLSGEVKSDPEPYSCQTDPRGVIGGSVMGVLLFIILICAGVFIWRRKPELLRGPKAFVESKVSGDKFKAIPVKKFPDHFNMMNRDQKRGFSEEYEEFSSVGKDQPRRAALLPDNRNRNRYTNILACDWSRVKLSDQNQDYINANYMPGYGNNNKQYIAAQGPLPSTVNDFWRMIWEQKSPCVVMVTNCKEGGKVKCEQYWPLDYTPCLYGDLLVTVQSEQMDSSWTLREFSIKDRTTSEERIVRHFHFTAWPDHGVPVGTKELIEFRGLVRQHMESLGASGPTVVHCSAGVGRTGTLIALDVLLQQLERDKAVGIAGFVRRMRNSRPFMVQTETQYVFLHQCIMDSLQPEEVTIPEEALYENSEMFYANATALREFHSANRKA